MDGSITLSSDSENVRGAADITADPSFFENPLEELCPFYMSMGMTYEEYWYGDNYLPRYYLKAYRLRQKQKDFEAWMQGKYIYEGIAALYPLFNALSKQHKPMPYVKEPYLKDAYKSDKQIEEEKNREAAREFEKLFAELNEQIRRKGDKNGR